MKHNLGLRTDNAIGMLAISIYKPQARQADSTDMDFSLPSWKRHLIHLMHTILTRASSQALESM